MWSGAIHPLARYIHAQAPSQPVSPTVGPGPAPRVWDLVQPARPRDLSSLHTSRFPLPLCLHRSLTSSLPIQKAHLVRTRLLLASYKVSVDRVAAPLSELEPAVESTLAATRSKRSRGKQKLIVLPPAPPPRTPLLEAAASRCAAVGDHSPSVARPRRADDESSSSGEDDEQQPQRRLGAMDVDGESEARPDLYEMMLGPLSSPQQNSESDYGYAGGQSSSSTSATGAGYPGSVLSSAAMTQHHQHQTYLYPTYFNDDEDDGDNDDDDDDGFPSARSTLGYHPSSAPSTYRGPPPPFARPLTPSASAGCGGPITRGAFSPIKRQSSARVFSDSTADASYLLKMASPRTAPASSASAAAAAAAGTFGRSPSFNATSSGFTFPPGLAASTSPLINASPKTSSSRSSLLPQPPQFASASSSTLYPSSLSHGVGRGKGLPDVPTPMSGLSLRGPTPTAAAVASSSQQQQPRAGGSNGHRRTVSSTLSAVISYHEAKRHPPPAGAAPSLPGKERRVSSSSSSHPIINYGLGFTSPPRLPPPSLHRYSHHHLRHHRDCDSNAEGAFKKRRALSFGSGSTAANRPTMRPSRPRKSSDPLVVAEEAMVAPPLTASSTTTTTAEEEDDLSAASALASMLAEASNLSQSQYGSEHSGSDRSRSSSSGTSASVGRLRGVADLGGSTLLRRHQQPQRTPPLVVDATTTNGTTAAGTGGDGDEARAAGMLILLHHSPSPAKARPTDGLSSTSTGTGAAPAPLGRVLMFDEADELTVAGGGDEARARAVRAIAAFGRADAAPAMEPKLASHVQSAEDDDVPDDDDESQATQGSLLAVHLDNDGSAAPPRGSQTTTALSSTSSSISEEHTPSPFVSTCSLPPPSSSGVLSSPVPLDTTRAVTSARFLPASARLPTELAPTLAPHYPMQTGPTPSWPGPSLLFVHLSFSSQS